MIAAYLYTDPAKADYEPVTHAGAKLEGAFRVSRDHAGKLHGEEEGHLARKAVGQADGRKLAALKNAHAAAQDEMKQPVQ